MKRKYILLILTFLTTLLCSVGSSLWLVLEEEKVSPPLFEGIEIDIENEAQIPVPVLPDSLTSGYFTGDLDLTYEEGTGTEVETNGVDIPGSWSITEMDFTAKSTDKNKVSVNVEVTFTPTDYTDVYNPTTVTQTITVIAVAQYGSEYYATVDGALQAANEANSGTVYVLPLGYELDTGIAKEAKTIRKTTTINSGVTLALPYESTTVYDKTNGKDTTLAFKTPSTCLKNNVTLATSLTNNGVIQIGGLISGGNAQAPYSSATTEKYAQLTLADGVTLTNKKTGEGQSAGIQCYGQITEENKGQSGGVICNGGTIIAPFTVRDHRGGSTYYAITGASYTDLLGSLVNRLTVTPDVTPFNKFYIPNITTFLKVENSGALYGYADLYANDQNNITTMNLIGNAKTFLIQLSSGSYATAIFDKDTEITKLDIYGSAAMNSMSMNLDVTYSSLNAKLALSTTKALFPINWHFNVGLHKKGNANATVTFSQSLKILPGGSLTIDEGVTANIANLAVFDTSFDDPGINAKTPYEEVYPATSSLNGTTIPSGKLIVNGTINASSSIGGLVETTNTGATLNASATSVDSKEIGSFSGSGLDASVTYKTFNLNLNVFLYVNGSVSSTPTNCEKGKYISKNGGWEFQEAIVISLNLDGGSISSSVNVPSDVETGTTSVSINLPNPTKDGYSFQGWSVTGGSLPSSKPNGSTTLTINAGVKSVEIKANWKKNSGCFAAGTLITLADGTQKKIENLTSQDVIMVFDHETGQITPMANPFIINNGFNEYPLLKLYFNDGTTFDILFAHGVFDCTTNQYEMLTPENIDSYVGHEFYTYTNGTARNVKLISYTIDKIETVCYSLMSPIYINHFANGLLCVSDDIEGLYNIFELDENMKVNQEKKAADIEKYGLYTYEEWADVFTYEQFMAFNVQYFKVAIGKGLFTYEDIFLYIEKHLSRFE